MQRVLDVPELIGTVFDLSDRYTLTSASLVCRHWNESASRRLWHELDTLTPLFEILSPFEKKVTQFVSLRAESFRFVTTFSFFSADF